MRHLLRVRSGLMRSVEPHRVWLGEEVMRDGRLRVHQNYFIINGVRHRGSSKTVYGLLLRNGDFREVSHSELCLMGEPAIIVVGGFCGEHCRHVYGTVSAHKEAKPLYSIPVSPVVVVSGVVRDSN